MQRSITDLKLVGSSVLAFDLLHSLFLTTVVRVYSSRPLPRYLFLGVYAYRYYQSHLIPITASCMMNERPSVMLRESESLKPDSNLQKYH
jgi:hypothetical protein